MPRNSNIQFRRGSSSDWSTNNPVLSNGEPGFDLTNKVIKVGDGSSQWSSLDSIAPFNTSLVEGSGIDLNYDSGTDSLAIAVDFSGTFNTDLAAGVGISLDYDSGTDVLTIGITLNQTVNGRLTLESGEPVSTTDQTAKTTLYFTPYKGNQVSVYNGTNWSVKTLSEISLSLSGYAADTNFDIFVYDNAGTLTLESAAWTDDTTRATALTTQDGIYVKSGATTRRYIGTIRTIGTTGQCEDSESKRFVWNYYNRVDRSLLAEKQSPHSYTSATKRPWGNITTYGETRYGFVVGISDTLIRNNHLNLSRILYVGFGVDSTTVISSSVTYNQETSTLHTHSSDYNFYPSVGFHYVQLIEYTDNANGYSYREDMNGVITC